MLYTLRMERMWAFDGFLECELTKRLRALNPLQLRAGVLRWEFIERGEGPARDAWPDADLKIWCRRVFRQTLANSEKSAGEKRCRSMFRQCYSGKVCRRLRRLAGLGKGIRTAHTFS